jgi:hypothetical protein
MTTDQAREIGRPHTYGHKSVVVFSNGFVLLDQDIKFAREYAKETDTVLFPIKPEGKPEGKTEEQEEKPDKKTK